MALCVGRESPRLNRGIAFETAELEYRMGEQILGVAVKCVDIKKNTGGEGGSLECY